MIRFVLGVTAAVCFLTGHVDGGLAFLSFAVAANWHYRHVTVSGTDGATAAPGRRGYM
jgi:hypothetical protein